MAAPIAVTAPSSVQNLKKSSSRRFDGKSRSLDDRDYYSERQNAKFFVVITVRRNSHISQLLVNYSIIICYNSNSYVSNLFGETLLTIWRNQRTNTLYCSVQLESKEPAPFCQVSTNKSWLIRSLIQASYRSEKFRLTWRIDWLIDLGFFAVSAVFQPFNGGCCYQNMASLKFP